MQTDGARQLAATPQPGMGAGQSPGVVRGGRRRGHIRDRVRVIGGAGQVPLCTAAVTTAIAGHYARRAERVEFTGLVLFNNYRLSRALAGSADRKGSRLEHSFRAWAESGLCEEAPGPTISTT
ncbi:hypothetical protein ACFXA3_08440 [Streptomyces sp. NPDC059456]|uniref:hypothetical protein n=1 Tax=Streptomyces sp. NPDC059456 TaxID=3346838 RepID=UPI0036A5CE55